MPQSLFRTFGGLTLPAAAGVDTLVTLDPARDILTGLLKQAITSELGDAWNAIAPSTALGAAAIVASTLPLEPTPTHLTALKKSLPVLCVYRKGAAPVDLITFSHDRITQQWGVDYILPPLGPEDERKLVDVLPAVAKVIRLAVDGARGHPDYDSGALQFFPGKGNLARIRVLNYQVGRARFADTDVTDTPTYLACSVTLETWEVSYYRDGSSTDLDGETFDLGVGDGEGVVPDLTAADTETASTR